MSYEEQLEIRSKQGYLVPGVEMKVVGTNGEVKWDGTEMGELCLRAPWIAESYYNDERTVEGFVMVGYIQEMSLRLMRKVA